MNNKNNIKILGILLGLVLSLNSLADGNKPILKNKISNPNYDPNKGLLGKPKEEKIIKRTRNEPIIKNRKYQPMRFQKKQ